MKVVETPGPTEHAISFVVQVDGRKTAFTGNLISGTGKVPNWFDLHWDYYGFTQGIDASEKSLRGPREASSRTGSCRRQGDPIADPRAAMAANRRVYAVLRDMLVPNELHRVQQEVRQILPHLVFVRRELLRHPVGQRERFPVRLRLRRPLADRRAEEPVSG